MSHKIYKICNLLFFLKDNFYHSLKDNLWWFLAIDRKCGQIYNSVLLKDITNFIMSDENLNLIYFLGLFFLFQICFFSYFIFMFYLCCRVSLGLSLIKITAKRTSLLIISFSVIYRDCRVVRDPQTLKSKGYGFVSFVKKSVSKFLY